MRARSNGWVLLFLCLALFPGRGWGQASDVPADSLPAFNALRTPISPAFVLLGVAPTTVERPTTPASFAATMVNASHDFSSLPQNYAVELAPYWLLGHPALSWRDDADRGLSESIQRTFTLTAATAQLGTDALPLTGLAVGGRTMLLSGRISEQSRRALRKIEESLAARGTLFHRTIQARRSVLDEQQEAELRAHPEQAAQIVQKYNVLFQGLEEEVRSEPAFREKMRRFDELHKLGNDFAVVREGLFWEMAGGALWTYPDAVWGDGAFQRWGFWSTVNYQQGPWSPVAVVRFLGEEGQANMLDVGARMIYFQGAFGLSAELVYRTFFEDEQSALPTPDDAVRLVAGVDYKINDTTWLVASFGKDHSDEAPGSLVASLGFSLNFSRSRYQLSE